MTASILRRLRSPEKRALTWPQVWGSDREYAYSNTAAGIHVNTEQALRLSTVWACVNLLAKDISGLPLHAFRELGPQQKEALPTPGWLRYPTNDPNVNTIQHLSEVVVSMLVDGNAFVQVAPSVELPDMLTVIDPRKVRMETTRGETLYHVQGGNRPLTPDEMIHIPLIRLPGERRGLNPIEADREGIGLGLAAEAHGASWFGNGATLSGIIALPEGSDLEAAEIDRIREDFKKRHVGARKSHAVGILTGGATFSPLSMSNRDSQYLELRKYQVEDIARLYNIPPHMIGSQEPGAVGYASVEQKAIDYVQHAVQPIVQRIEAAYDRLLPGQRPPFNRGQRTYFRFNMDGLLRGDQKSRYEAYQIALNAKFAKVDEVRAREDWPPFGGTEGGFLQTPNNNAPAGEPNAA